MFIVRNTFTAKPGMAGKLAAQLKDVSAGHLKNVRVMTDLTGDFNQVVLEHQVASLAELEAVMQQYMTDPVVREKSKGYTEFWTTGRREIFRVA